MKAQGTGPGEFYDLIADSYRELFPLEGAKVSFVNEYLSGPRVLDVGCGSGDLGVALAAEGVAYLGIDLNRRMIEAAQALAADRAPAPGFRVMDLLAIDALGQFDGILCLGNTLPHLKTPGLVEAFFAKVHRQLKPGGVFVVQLLNYDRILSDRSVAFDTLETATLVFRRAYTNLTDDEVTFRVELENKATRKTLTDETKLQPLRRGVILKLAEARGFVLDGEFRGFDRTPADEGDFSRVLVFRKSAR